MKRAGTHLVALASSKDMVSTSRAAGEGPLNTKLHTKHTATSANTATVRTTSNVRRSTVRITRRIFFTVSFMSVTSLLQNLRKS